MLAGRERLGAFPLDPVQVDQVPQEHRLALEQIKAITAKAPAGGEDHAFRPALRHIDVGRDRVGSIQQHRRVALRQTNHWPRIDELGAPGRDVGAWRDDTGRDRRIHREDLMLLRLGDEFGLHLLDLPGVAVRKVGRLVEVLVQVEQLQHLIVQRIRIGCAKGLPRCTIDLRTEEPAVVIQRPLAHHFKILGLVPLWCLGVLGVEGIEEAGAFDWRLLDAVDHLRRVDAGGFENGRHDVDDVHELLAQGALVLDARRPRNHHVLVDAAQLRGVLFEPRKRGIKRPRPACRHVVISVLGAPDIVVLHLHIDRQLVEAVEERDLVGRAHRPALGAGAVVAVDIDDQRVFELPDILEGLDDTADLVVAIGSIGSEDFNLTDEELLLLCRQLVPILDDVGRPGRQLGVLRDHAELFLVLENLLTQLVPALIKELHLADLVHPLLGRMVGRMRRPWGVLDKYRLVRLNLMHPVQVIDGVVGHTGHQIPARLAFERIDLRGIAEQVRLPLVGVATDKPIEIFETHARRPLFKRTGLAGRKGRYVVILAEPRGGVAIVEQHAADGCLILGDDAVVAGEAGGLLGDHAEARRVMVAPGDQGSTRRRAQRGGEHAVVAQAFIGDAVHGRGRDHATEGAGYAEAGIIGDDQQHVGRTFGRHNTGRPPGLGFQGIFLDDATEFGIRCRQLLVADRGRCTGRTQRTGDLLGYAGYRKGC